MFEEVSHESACTDRCRVCAAFDYFEPRLEPPDEPSPVEPLPIPLLLPPLVLLPVPPPDELPVDEPPVDESLGERPIDEPESVLLPDVPPVELPEVPLVPLPELPPEVLPPGVLPGELPGVPLAVPPPGAVVPPPVKAPVSGGVCFVEPDEELALPEVPPPPWSELVPPPPPRLQAARLIVNNPRINSVFDVPRLDLITIPFKSGCVDYGLDWSMLDKFQHIPPVSAPCQMLPMKLQHV
jgi:hypothetical protein